MKKLIIGIFIGTIIGVFTTSLAAVSRDNVTVTYSGYQPKIDKIVYTSDSGSSIQTCERCKKGR